MEFPDLHLYVPQRNHSVAHVIRQYPDGKIYVFCNRYFGEANGLIYAFKDAETPTHRNQPLCTKCQSAIETALERAAVFAGLHPKGTP